jgi:hypothetical protein
MGLKLETILNPNHRLCRHSIDWHDIYTIFPELLLAGHEKRFLRLMVALVILQEHSKKDNSALMLEWCENPYWQAFCGITDFQWSAPATVEQFSKFQRIAGPDRLQILRSMAENLASSVSVPKQEGAQPSAYRAHHGSGVEASDIRRSLISASENNADRLSNLQAAEKVIPHFESTEPVMLNMQPSGEGIQILVEPMGEAPFQYRWEKWVENEPGMKLLEESQTATIHIENPPPESLTAFRCLVSNAHAPNGIPSRWHFIRPHRKTPDANSSHSIPA